ncbi:uncharacterized protein N7473_002358 [Penicillium subrubescens]|uniref:uncharacterized protein n=1 Tax=Penicillium subrubescens TaxID=1316194 RepID=UPI0025456B0D|nr:uncharacterized protein N7473_002358 [Penicillium subrubescens]KAJ5905442.1 hypothetical protein N7473_002358 [Penicillium subrubescens]
MYKYTYSSTAFRPNAKAGVESCWEWRRGSEAPSHTRDDIVVADVGAECSWVFVRDMSYGKRMEDEGEE